ncbi:hypothetical protein MTR67_049086 [Solanum verrucosum]|uniref:Reverse transcriptase zinc-binding domain-containing protein n=1 Tax=Solanum verrucosum TaxID=315347 RepID=A0AAF0V2L6_SOLVR|nr:hypothetical protein MTR67_049086 [Solanum verrucosum]
MVVEDQDKILWGNSKEKTYTVKECYKNMSSQNGILLIWSWKHVWKTRQALIVSCFTWTALKEVCLAQDNLRKKGVILINRCVMCKQINESVNHLFCTALQQLVYGIFSTLCLAYNGLTAATMAGVVNKFFITSLIMWAAPIAILYAFNHNLIPVMFYADCVIILTPSSAREWESVLKGARPSPKTMRRGEFRKATKRRMVTLRVLLPHYFANFFSSPVLLTTDDETSATQHSIGVTDMSPHSMTLVSGFVAVISVNVCKAVGAKSRRGLIRLPNKTRVNGRIKGGLCS